LRTFLVANQQLRFNLKLSTVRFGYYFVEFTIFDFLFDYGLLFFSSAGTRILFLRISVDSGARQAAISGERLGLGGCFRCGCCLSEFGVVSYSLVRAGRFSSDQDDFASFHRYLNIYLIWQNKALQAVGRDGWSSSSSDARSVWCVAHAAEDSGDGNPIQLTGALKKSLNLMNSLEENHHSLQEAHSRHAGADLLPIGTTKHRSKTSIWIGAGC